MTTVAGADVAYVDDRAWVAVVRMDLGTLDVLEEVVVPFAPVAPYVPGRFWERELPPVVEAAKRLQERPDVWLFDGHGRAHPQRFGLACRLGEALGEPAIGCAKTPLCGTWTGPGPRKGDVSDLVHRGEVIGRVLRTRDATRPVFVSEGWGVSLDEACDVVLRCARFRIPEPLRRADALARRAASA